MKEKCIAPSCKRNVEIKKHKLCRTHAARFYRTGDIIEDKKIIHRKLHAPYSLQKNEAV
jgi:hypothetical protein